MIEGAFIFLLLIFVVLVASGLFLLWLTMSVVKGVGRALLPKRKPAHLVSPAGQMCGNIHCRTENPSAARFCRRCGQSLPMLMKIIPSTAAA